MDKCITFGMTKMNGAFDQFQPALYINNEKIPAVPSGESFVYLGKIFSFVFWVKYSVSVKYSARN